MKYEQDKSTVINNTGIQNAMGQHRTFKVGRYLVPILHTSSELLNELLASQGTAHNKHTLTRKGTDYYYTHPGKVECGLPYEIMLSGRIIFAMVRVASCAVSVRIDENEIASLQLDMLTDCLTIIFKK